MTERDVVKLAKRAEKEEKAQRAAFAAFQVSSTTSVSCRLHFAALCDHRCEQRRLDVLSRVSAQGLQAVVP